MSNSKYGHAEAAIQVVAAEHGSGPRKAPTSPCFHGASGASTDDVACDEFDRVTVGQRDRETGTTINKGYTDAIHAGRRMAAQAVRFSIMMITQFNNQREAAAEPLEDAAARIARWNQRRHQSPRTCGGVIAWSRRSRGRPALRAIHWLRGARAKPHQHHHQQQRQQRERRSPLDLATAQQ